MHKLKIFYGLLYKFVLSYSMYKGGPCKVLQVNNSKNICQIKKLFMKKFRVFKGSF